MDDEMNEFGITETESYDTMEQEIDERMISFDEAFPATKTINQLESAILGASKAIIGGYAIDIDELTQLISELKRTFNNQVDSAKEILDDRDRILSSAETEAEKLLNRAKTDSDHLVSTNEITRRAKTEAEEMLRDAETGSRKMRMEAIDYSISKLTEINKELEISRDKLQGEIDATLSYCSLMRERINQMIDEEIKVLEEELIATKKAFRDEMQALDGVKDGLKQINI